MNARTTLSLEALEDRTVPSFLAPISSAGGGASLVVADFNRDDLDDVVSIDGKSSVSVRAGNGDGTFRPPLTLNGGKGSLYGLEAKDYNNDSKLDIGAYGYNSGKVSVCLDPLGGSCSTFYQQYLTVWLGNGDGSFGSGSATKSGLAGSKEEPGFANLTVADFNRDGILDRATVTWQGAAVQVSLGNGDGTYQAPQSHPAGSGTRSVGSGDLNGDGWADLVVVRSPRNGNYSLAVLLNDGNW